MNDGMSDGMSDGMGDGIDEFVDLVVSIVNEIYWGINQKARFEIVMLINSGIADVKIPSNCDLFCLEFVFVFVMSF